MEDENSVYRHKRPALAGVPPCHVLTFQYISQAKNHEDKLFMRFILFMLQSTARKSLKFKRELPFIISH